jgi:RNA polymerase sigma factor (sigma-70 family)
VLSKHWRRQGKNVPVEESDLSGSGEEIERSVLLGQLVDALPADQRTVVLRRFVDQRSIRQIALELGRSEGAVKQLQLRALEKLREKMVRRS